MDPQKSDFPPPTSPPETDRRRRPPSSTTPTARSRPPRCHASSRPLSTASRPSTASPPPGTRTPTPPSHGYARADTHSDPGSPRTGTSPAVWAAALTATWRSSWVSGPPRPPTPPCGGSCCTSHTSAAWSGRLRGQRHATAGGQRQALEPRTPHGCRPGPRVLQPHQSHGAGGPRRPRPTPVPRCLVTGNHDDLPIDRQREFAQWIQDQGGAEVVVRVDHRGGTPSSYS
jgi:hypothetical protein